MLKVFSKDFLFSRCPALGHAPKGAYSSRSATETRGCLRYDQAIFRQGAWTVEPRHLAPQLAEPAVDPSSFETTVGHPLDANENPLASQDKQEKEAKAKAASGAQGPKQSPGEMRLAKDISELTLGPTVQIEFPDGKDNLLHFLVTIKPDEGYYKGGKFVFNFNVPGVYLHEPPKVKCTQKVYHPNLDYDGNVCLNILREDWKPVLSISSCILRPGSPVHGPEPRRPAEQGRGKRPDGEPAPV